ncbi:hypothetical protein [Methanococcus voltae]|uniref:Flagellin N-methylase n=1 Tax=Methanococcus voltae (strain ATCC BAA-1334 / A3) TaxID=456320 RepID=D7DQG3_METV3|nr:hypothetical protein [Methanococcus voltae]MCS3901675.1 putative cysteine cluster protein YcgN (CxxCxxCC family) [Methanococcus voltae]
MNNSKVLKRSSINYDKNHSIKISETIFPDEICEQCGRCCIVHAYEDYENEKMNVVYCKHLNLETKRCSIYKDRFHKEKGCLSMMEAILVKALPKDCPYVAKIKNYEEPAIYEKIRNSKKELSVINEE